MSRIVCQFYTPGIARYAWFSSGAVYVYPYTSSEKRVGWSKWTHKLYHLLVPYPPRRLLSLRLILVNERRLVCEVNSLFFEQEQSHVEIFFLHLIHHTNLTVIARIL